jgi:hypothetical protein
MRTPQKGDIYQYIGKKGECKGLYSIEYTSHFDWEWTIRFKSLTRDQECIWTDVKTLFDNFKFVR